MVRVVYALNEFHLAVIEHADLDGSDGFNQLQREIRRGI